MTNFPCQAIHTSGFSSLLASPPLTPPINNVDDFANQNLRLGEIDFFDIQRLQKQFLQYNYSKLINRIEYEGSLSDRQRHVKSGDFGYIVTKFSNQYITDIPLRNMTKIIPMRLMKTCFNRLYSTFAFPRQSPYCPYFSAKLSR